ncbi:hypothetical protein [Vibrio rhizosphaerae]|uniref:hypothetical protein n=1 Tax=Vibrio rhizosphaerae TaxID=398736 RepID=UPI00056F86A6|nr:hypothetical protein [Vibrio rhizosphaerae]
MSDYRIKQSLIFGAPEPYSSSDELIKYLDSVGMNLSRVIIEFNALEDEISYYICDLFSADDAEKIYAFIGEMMFKKKAMKLLQLYHIECRSRGLDFQDVLKDLDKKLKDTATQRNSVTHGGWLFSSPSKGTPVSLKSNNKGLSKTHEQFDVEKLQSIINDITTARAHLSHFHTRFKKLC